MADTVTMELVDAADGHLIASAAGRPEDFPPDFGTVKTLSAGERSFEVVAAEPATRAAYAVAGRLVVRVRELARVSPSDLLFSLPSIADGLPALVDGDEDHALTLHPDAWRQVELVASSRFADVERELRGIARVFETARAGAGFSRLHARAATGLLGPTPPLLDELRRELPEGSHALSGGVSFFGEDGVADGSFCLRTPAGLDFYGVARDGRLESVALWAGPGVQLLEPELDDLARVLERFEWLAVDWCRLAVHGPEPRGLAHLFA